MRPKRNMATARQTIQGLESKKWGIENAWTLVSTSTSPPESNPPPEVSGSRTGFGVIKGEGSVVVCDNSNGCRTCRTLPAGRGVDPLTTLTAKRKDTINQQVEKDKKTVRHPFKNVSQVLPVSSPSPTAYAKTNLRGKA